MSKQLFISFISIAIYSGQPMGSKWKSLVQMVSVKMNHQLDSQKSRDNCIPSYKTAGRRVDGSPFIRLCSVRLCVCFCIFFGCFVSFCFLFFRVFGFLNIVHNTYMHIYKLLHACGLFLWLELHIILLFYNVIRALHLFCSNVL